MIQRKVSIILENKPGALVRVVGLFHQRGYNIESLHVDPVNDLTEYKYVEKNLNIKLKKGEVSHLIISTTVNDNLLRQILRQINKLIDVLIALKVVELPDAGVINNLTLLLLISLSKVARLSPVFTIANSVLNVIDPL